MSGRHMRSRGWLTRGVSARRIAILALAFATCCVAISVFVILASHLSSGNQTSSPAGQLSADVGVVSDVRDEVEASDSDGKASSGTASESDGKSGNSEPSHVAQEAELPAIETTEADDARESGVSGSAARGNQSQSSSNKDGGQPTTETGATPEGGGSSYDSSVPPEQDTGVTDDRGQENLPTTPDNKDTELPEI